MMCLKEDRPFMSLHEKGLISLLRESAEQEQQLQVHAEEFRVWKSGIHYIVGVVIPKSTAKDTALPGLH